MAKVEHTSDARALVGIDISKHRHEVLIAVPGKTRRRRLTITNSTLHRIESVGSGQAGHQGIGQPRQGNGNAHWEGLRFGKGLPARAAGTPFAAQSDDAGNADQQ